MIPEEVRNAPNPYHPIMSKLKVQQFIGREMELDILYGVLEEFKSTSVSRNILISGEKSIGKSSLLNRFNQILQDYNFIIYQVPLLRNDSIEVDEFEFFKDLIDNLFLDYAPIEGTILDSGQSEIWFSLTSGKYEHDSDFMDRKLRFASTYASKKQGIQEKLSYKFLERDFSKIVGDISSGESEIAGLAIMIDEFQVLAKNPFIVEVLRQLSEQIDSLMIIGAGLPSFLGNPIFEKFNRISIPINLKGFHYVEILDLIFKPIQEIGNYTRFDAQKWFDPYAIREIIERSGGNPLHVKILCAKMFDHVKQNPSCEQFGLNSDVMDNVIEFYSSISVKSNTIRSSLQSCSPDQLEAFKLLYEYEGFNIRAALLLKLAFQPIEQEGEESIRQELVNAFEKLSGFGLFEFSDASLTLEQLREMPLNKLAQFEYCFIGTPIDKLYASYYYKTLTKHHLQDNQSLTFEDMLAHKLGTLFNLTELEENFPENFSVILRKLPKLIHVIDQYELEGCAAEEIFSDLNKLIKLAEGRDEKSEQRIRSLARKHHLDLPSFLARFFLLKGFYMLIADVTIKGRRKVIYNFFPVLKEVNEIVEISKQITNLSGLNLSLADYMVNINYAYLLWLPQTPLVMITHLEMVDEYQILVKLVKESKFDQAVQVAYDMVQKDTHIEERHFLTNIDTYNNYGFCLININKIDEAAKVLRKCSNESMIARANLAYVHFLQHDRKNAKSILSKMARKKAGVDYRTRFMHLAIEHPLLTTEYKIVEDCDLFNIVVWNAALISTQANEAASIAGSFLKKVSRKDRTSPIHKRVLSWISFFKGDVSQATNIASEILSELQEENEHIAKLIKKDIDIFQHEHEQLPLLKRVYGNNFSQAPDSKETIFKGS